MQVFLYSGIRKYVERHVPCQEIFEEESLAEATQHADL